MVIIFCSIMGQKLSNLKRIINEYKMDRDIHDSSKISVVANNNVTKKNNTDCNDLSDIYRSVENSSTITTGEKYDNLDEKSKISDKEIIVKSILKSVVGISRKYKFDRKKSINDRTRKHWVSKFHRIHFQKRTFSNSNACLCTAYRKIDFSDNDLKNDTIELKESEESIGDYRQKFNSENFCLFDEPARAREISEDVESPNGLQFETVDNITTLFRNALSMSAPASAAGPIHAQIDYINCLVPDLREITSCSFYWGKMDRYQAECLLENKPEGTFLLRDSAQEGYLFSVSFRKYGRSLHARIEQWNHKFSFDSHDPGVFASPTICGLIKHYKDPTCCMFFEPMLTIPLHRNFPFSLQQLARASVYARFNYDDINALKLPRLLKSYLKEYHYSQRVHIRIFDAES